MKIVICPYDNYDFAGREQWLSKLASRGLFVRGYFSSLFFLTEDEPKQRRFHIEPPSKSSDYYKQLEQTELFSLSGWQEMCRFDGGLTVYYTDDPTAPDPYTDEDSKAEALKPLDESYRKYAFRHGLIWGGLALFILFLLIKAGALPMLVISVPLSFSVCMVWTIIREFRTQRRIRKMRKSLSEGCIPAAGKPVKPAAEICYMLLSYAALAMVLILYLGPDARDFSPELPALTAIDGAPILAQREPASGNGFSILAPIQYGEYQQTEEYRYEKFKGSYYQGISSLRTKYYYLTVPALGETVARMEMRASGSELAKSAAQIETYGLDMMLWGQEDDQTVAAFQNGHHLVVYRYRGETDLKEHMELLMAPVG